MTAVAPAFPISSASLAATSADVTHKSLRMEEEGGSASVVIHEEEEEGEVRGGDEGTPYEGEEKKGGTADPRRTSSSPYPFTVLSDSSSDEEEDRAPLSSLVTRSPRARRPPTPAHLNDIPLLSRPKNSASLVAPVLPPLSNTKPLPSLTAQNSSASISSSQSSSSASPPVRRSSSPVALPPPTPPTVPASSAPPPSQLSPLPRYLPIRPPSPLPAVSAAPLISPPSELLPAPSSSSNAPSSSSSAISSPSHSSASRARQPPPVKTGRLPARSPGPSSNPPSPTSVLSPATALVQMLMTGACDFHRAAGQSCPPNCPRAHPVTDSSTVNHNGKRHSSSQPADDERRKAPRTNGTSDRHDRERDRDRERERERERDRERESREREHKDREGGRERERARDREREREREMKERSREREREREPSVAVSHHRRDSDHRHHPVRDERAPPHRERGREEVPPPIPALPAPAAAAPASFHHPQPIRPGVPGVQALVPPPSPQVASTAARGTFVPPLPTSTICARNVFRLPMFEPFFNQAGDRPSISFCFACHLVIKDPTGDPRRDPPHPINNICSICGTNYHYRCASTCIRHRCFICNEMQAAGQSSQSLYTCLLCPRSFCFMHASQPQSSFSSLPNMRGLSAASATLLTALTGQLMRQSGSLRFLSRLPQSQVGICKDCEGDLDDEEQMRQIQGKRRKRFMDKEVEIRRGTLPPLPSPDRG